MTCDHPELACGETKDGKHLWRDTGDSLRCVTYRCDACGRRGSGDPGVPFGGHVTPEAAVRAIVRAARTLPADDERLWNATLRELVDAWDDLSPTAPRPDRVEVTPGVFVDAMLMPSGSEPMHDSADE